MTTEASATGPGSFRASLDSPDFARIVDSANLPLLLGRTADGTVRGFDLAKRAALLVVGPDGTGKSVCTNALIASLLAKRSPDDVRLLLFDPTRVELGQYDGLPHLLAPPLIHDEQGRHALDWLADFASRQRRDILAGFRMRNIRQYREMGSANRDPMPYVVAVLEEAEVLLDEPRVRDALATIARLGPDVGVHLIISTGGVPLSELVQFFDHEWLSLVSFGRPDTRVLHLRDDDHGGGPGSMLYQVGLSAVAERLWVVQASDADISALVAHWRSQGKPEYVKELMMPAGVERTYEDFDPIAEEVFAEHPGLDPRISRLHPSVRLTGSEGIPKGARVRIEVTNAEGVEWKGFEVACVVYDLADGTTIGSARKRFDRKLRPGERAAVSMEVDTSLGGGTSVARQAGFFVGVPSVKMDGRWQ